jgi:hypothetical protein
MSSAALFRILFWPRLEPLGWIFFESRRAAGAKNRLPQAVRCENVKTDEGERSILMSDTKGASHTSEGKISSSRLGSSSISCRRRPFFSCR